MPVIDYEAVLADLESQKTKFNSAMDNAIAGIKTVLAMQSQSQDKRIVSTPESRPAPKRGIFGRDPSLPTLADRIATAMPPNGDPMHVSEIKRRVKEGGKEVTDNVLYDTLTRKDKHGRFKKGGRGMFGLNPDYVSINGHSMTK